MTRISSIAVATVVFYSGFIAAPAIAQQWTAVRLHIGSHKSTAYATAGPVIGGTAYFGGAYFEPVRWDVSSGTWSQITPAGYAGGQVNAAFQDALGGSTGFEGTAHAGLWTAQGTNFTDLHPSSNPFISSIADLDSTQQAGYVRRTVANPYNRAALWHGTAASYVDLHPSASINESEAYACAAGQQGGFYRVTSGSASHAALWSGTAASMIDLHPTSVIDSGIFGMALGQQVGVVGAPGTHAALWRGSAASFIDMNPPGAGVSLLNATCGSAQVGWANIGVVSAGVWFGTPESFQPLHQYLPSGYRQSIATGVSIINGTYYISGYANNNATGRDEAFVWIGVPSPGTVAAFSAAAAMSARRLRR